MCGYGYRWVRRHVVPGHRGGVRPGDEHVERGHGADVGAVGARVGRVLPAGGAARRQRAAARRAEEARQATLRLRLLAHRHLVWHLHIQERRHPHCQQHHRNSI